MKKFFFACDEHFEMQLSEIEAQRVVVHGQYIKLLAQLGKLEECAKQTRREREAARVAQLNSIGAYLEQHSWADRPFRQEDEAVQ